LLGKLVAGGGKIVQSLHAARRRHAHPLWQVQFVSDQEGIVEESFYEEKLASLSSKYWIQRAPVCGTTVTKTIDLFTSPGIVFMSHPDVEVLEQDYKRIREWERQHSLFRVRDPEAAVARRSIGQSPVSVE